ncbi:MAG: response regulator [Bdellovibrionales bacterium]|nr:response regulator [Bdellovibrionales bacterium]
MVKTDRVLQILSINESEKDNREILQHLECLGYPIQCERVSNLEEFLVNLELLPWDVVLFMSSTSTFTSREALQHIKKNNYSLPFVLISDGIGEEEVANLMKAGAEDVVLLSRSHRLLQVVRRVLRESEVKEKEAKASQIAHQAYAAREQMLAIVSHDIKNPLSAVQLEAQMLLKVAERHAKSPLADSVKIQANRILKTTDRLKALIADLLDKNKNEDGLACLSKSESCISKIFQDVLDSNRPLIKQKHLTIQTHFISELKLDVDENKIFQVLCNLLSNAIKFTPAFGVIDLRVEESVNDYIFSVVDTGPGLLATDLNLVFEKYWTGGVEGRSGTGLGLFICKIIVEAHGGQIRVENQPEIGSRFWFSLPKLSRTPEFSHWIKDHKQKILIIDDDEDLREVIAWALGKEGYAVHTYSDPEEALESLKNGRHLPHLIVVDYQMDDMNGTDFLMHKKMIDLQQVRECPVVMISASPDEALNFSSADLYNEILTKPIDLEALVQKIKKYIEV